MKPAEAHTAHPETVQKRAALYTLRTARELNQLERVILGTDGPAGSGVQPLGIIRMVAMLSSLGEVPAEIAFCFATGNTARLRNLDCIITIVTLGNQFLGGVLYHAVSILAFVDWGDHISFEVFHLAISS